MYKTSPHRFRLQDLQPNRSSTSIRSDFLREKRHTKNFGGHTLWTAGVRADVFCSQQCGSNSPSIVCEVTGGSDNMYVYLDDNLAASLSGEHLSALFDCLGKHGVMITASKCEPGNLALQSSGCSS